MTMPAKFGRRGQVEVYEENLTDISENIFWMRETVDQIMPEMLTVLQTIAANQTVIINLLNEGLQKNTPLETVQNNYFEHSPREKLSKRLIATAEWLTVNDPDGKLSVRQVAQGAGVSVGTAQSAIKVIEDEKRSK